MFIHPFPHIVVDNFVDDSLAKELSNDFLPYDDSSWFFYNNPLEHKKTLNNWSAFPKTTYSFFNYLISTEFVEKLKKQFNLANLYPDAGLHGAGWHIHGAGGKLNVHLDYSLHPKLQYQRKLNLILYLSENWDSSWGGNLEFWSHDFVGNQPLKLEKVVECKFNRAVIFDTTQNSWHGFADQLRCPKSIYRKSIAMYYLIDPPDDVEERHRALFAPSDDQKDSIEIKEFIKSRSL